MTEAHAPREVSLPERLFYGLIFLAALFVAQYGYFAPKAMQRSFTWAKLPPLHAQFVATLYLFGAAFCLAAMIARRARPIRPAMGGILVFTGVLFLVTVRNLGAFDFSLGPVWVWSLSYVIYPIIAIGFLVARRGHPAPKPSAAVTSGWIRGLLMVYAVVFGLLGALMFIVPDLIVSAWPWPVTSGLVQAYSSPFLTVAFCAGAYADRRTWPDVMPLLPALLVLDVGTLVVSFVHSGLFSATAIATWLWFGGFGAGAVAVAAALVVLARRPRSDFGRGTATVASAATTSDPL